MLEKAFGAWKAAAPRSRRGADAGAPQLDERQIYLVDKPGRRSRRFASAGSACRDRRPTTPRSKCSTRFSAARSRRGSTRTCAKKHGYTYGASSAFDMRLSAGPFLAAAGVQTDKTADALREFFNELNGILKPIPRRRAREGQELRRARFPGEFETIGDMARKLEELVVYNLPETTSTRLRAGGEDGDRRRRAEGRRHATSSPTRSPWSSSAIARRSRPGIAALNLGPIRVVPIDELFNSPIVVVGAGAAGLVAAHFRAGGRRRVIVLERTADGGRKILISGGGRCNILPSRLAPERFVTDSPPHLLRGMLRAWPLAAQRAFFEDELGLPLALEAETGKLFPHRIALATCAMAWWRSPPTRRAVQLQHRRRRHRQGR